MARSYIKRRQSKETPSKKNYFKLKTYAIYVYKNPMQVMLAIITV